MEPSRAREAIDELVARFFAAFDNRHGAQPRWVDVAGCFAEKATIVRRTGAGTDLYTVSEFAIPRIELLSGGSLVDFHEWESSATTEVFGGIAVRTSRYSKAGLLHGNAYGGSGTKCFQVAMLEPGWRITSLAWVDDGT